MTCDDSCDHAFTQLYGRLLAYKLGCGTPEEAAVATKILTEANEELEKENEKLKDEVAGFSAVQDA